jgi:hypothetical protein
MQLEILNDKIFYFKNALPNHKEIVDHLKIVENDLITKWIPWGNKYGTSIEQLNGSELTEDFGLAKCVYDPVINNIDTSSCKESLFVYESVSAAIQECGKIYSEKNNIDLKNNPRIEHSGFVVGKYKTGSARGLHIDCPYDDEEHSYVIYYNDNYVGGELFFPEYDLLFKPEAGSVVMFKSNDVDNIHEAIPTTFGYKYITPHFWRMGPSQGFIEYNAINNKESDLIGEKKAIGHDFENLKIVNNLRQKQIADYLTI